MYLGCTAPPFFGSLLILLHAKTPVIHHTEVVLGVGVAILSSLRVPLYCSFVILRHAFSLVEHTGERELRPRMAL